MCDDRPPAGTLFLSLNLMYPVTPQHLPSPRVRVSGDKLDCNRCRINKVELN